MKTVTYSIAVKREINAINEQQSTNTTTKRINVELICALLTLGAIVGAVCVLNCLGLIREF